MVISARNPNYKGVYLFELFWFKSLGYTIAQYVFTKYFQEHVSLILKTTQAHLYVSEIN